MSMICNWIYYISLILGFLDNAFAKYPTMVRDKSENSRNGNINVVLFLAGMTSSSCPPEELPFIKIPQVGKVKPCPSRGGDNNYPTNFGAVVKRCKKPECDCRKLLETSIITLNSWARNALQMTTAVVSLTHDEKQNKDENEFKYYSYKLETIDSITPKSKSGEVDDVVIVNSDHKNCNKPSKENFPRFSGNPLEKLNQNLFEASKDIQNTNQFPSNPIAQFKYHKNEVPSDDGNVRRFQRSFVVEPENTQVFELESAFNDEPNEIVDLPVFRRASKPDPFWDLLGIMSAMRKSFFGNYMNPSSDPQQRMAEEENGGNYNSMGKKQDLSLFKLVKTTFCNIKEQTRENNNGFIIIIFGGNLSDTANPYSDFIQSVKYVQESSCPEKTLIIVTGDCPDNITGMGNNGDNGGNGNGGGNGGRYERNKEISIPLYAKGPHANIIAKAKDIPDIPVQIKAALNKKSDECKQMNMRNLEVDDANKNSKEDTIFSKYLMDGDDMSDIKNKEKPKVVVKRDVSKMYQSGSIKKLLNKFAIYMWCILYFISFM